MGLIWFISFGYYPFFSGHNAIINRTNRQTFSARQLVLNIAPNPNKIALYILLNAHVNGPNAFNGSGRNCIYKIHFDSTANTFSDRRYQPMLKYHFYHQMRVISNIKWYSMADVVCVWKALKMYQYVQFLNSMCIVFKLTMMRSCLIFRPPTCM